MAGKERVYLGRGLFGGYEDGIKRRIE